MVDPTKLQMNLEHIIGLPLSTVMSPPRGLSVLIGLIGATMLGTGCLGFVLFALFNNLPI